MKIYQVYMEDELDFIEYGHFFKEEDAAALAQHLGAYVKTVVVDASIAVLEYIRENDLYYWNVINSEGEFSGVVLPPSEEWEWDNKQLRNSISIDGDGEINASVWASTEEKAIEYVKCNESINTPDQRYYTTVVFTVPS